MIFYDFIDIGINTENDNKNKKGVIIEPIKYLLDIFVNNKNSIKLNMNISDYESKNEMIYTTTLYQIMLNLNIDGVYCLNLNLYKDNLKLLKSFFEENRNNRYLPHIILCKYEDISIFSINHYYDLIFENYYYKLKLNLTKIKNKKKLSKLIKHYYFDNHDNDDNNDNNDSYDDYEEAKEYCIKNNCSGISYYNNKYQVKTSKYLSYDENIDIYSWIYI